MTTYKDIHGTKVEVRDDDPANPVNGQVWYNSGTLKGHKVSTVGAWATAANMNTSRYSGAAAGATGTAALAFGGSIGPASTDTVNTETWNGSAWTEVANLNLARNQFGGFGTSTSALAIGGNKNPGAANETEIWNGSGWTEVNDLNTGVKDMAGAGYNSNTSGLKFGGANDSGTTGNTEEWNGTSWAEVNNLNTARNGVAGAGTKSSALVFGADPSAVTAEEWSQPFPSTVSFTVS